MNKTTRERTDQAIGIDQAGIYRVKVSGRHADALKNRFDDMRVFEPENERAEVTVLTGVVVDQAALHGLIARVRDLGMSLVLVELIRPIREGE